MTRRSEYPFIIYGYANKWGPGKCHAAELVNHPVWGPRYIKPLCRDYVHGADSRVAPTKFLKEVTCKKCLQILAKGKSDD